MKLSKKQEDFTVKYFECGNQREAYLHAYPTSKKWKIENVDSNASTLASRTKVKARLKELRASTVEPAKVTHQMLTEELFKMGFFDVKELFDDDGNLLPIKQMSEAATKTISSVKVTYKVTGKGKDKETHQLTEIKLNDKGQSLDKLAKHLGYYELDNNHTLTARVEQYTKLPERKKDK